MQFYSFQASQSQPKMMVVPDAESPYCPTANTLFSPLNQSRKQIEGLLDQIPRIFAGTQSIDCCGVSAIEACMQALKVNFWGMHVEHPVSLWKGVQHQVLWALQCCFFWFARHALHLFVFFSMIMMEKIDVLLQIAPCLGGFKIMYMICLLSSQERLSEFFQREKPKDGVWLPIFSIAFGG